MTRWPGSQLPYYGTSPPHSRSSAAFLHMPTMSGTLSTPRAEFRLNGRVFPARQLKHPLIQAAREQPGKIDQLLRPYLHNETFPSDLAVYLHDYTDLVVTPGLHGDAAPDRPRWYYANSLIDGMLLGRAYKLLSTPTRPPRDLSNPIEFPFSRLPAELRLQIWGYYKEDAAQRKRLWDVMVPVFIKGLWSGRNPEEGARYITGVLMLACGCALANVSHLLVGLGFKWVWWDDKYSDPDLSWGWQELVAAIMKTAKLPRTNTSIQAVRDRWWYPDRAEQHSMGVTSPPEYVSEQTLAVLDLAREHLKSGERDWTPPELVAKFLDPMFEGMEDARQIWVATGFVPQVYEGLDSLDRVTRMFSSISS